jgi:hypothetical protein
VESGLADLRVLRSAQSAFSGFLRDRYTTLPETEDRILATVIEAWWLYTGTELPFTRLRQSIRQTLLETFADHQSASVQHTLHAMGEAALARHGEVSEMRLTLPTSIICGSIFLPSACATTTRSSWRPRSRMDSLKRRSSEALDRPACGVPVGNTLRNLTLSKRLFSCRRI